MSEWLADSDPEKPRELQEDPAAEGGSRGDALNRRTLDRLEEDTSPEMAAEMVAIFMKETHSRLIEMGDALERREFAALEDQAHTLKSSAETFGLDRVKQSAQQLETACRAGEEGMVGCSPTAGGNGTFCCGPGTSGLCILTFSDSAETGARSPVPRRGEAICPEGGDADAGGVGIRRGWREIGGRSNAGGGGTFCRAEPVRAGSVRAGFSNTLGPVGRIVDGLPPDWPEGLGTGFRRPVEGGLAFLWRSIFRTVG